MSKTLYSGIAQVTMTVEIAFATANPLTASPTWADVTQYVRSISIRRGRWTEQSDNYDAGKCEITFKNSTRIFDPLYTAGTYFGQLVPMKQIRVRATYSAVTYDLFRGFVDGFPQNWDPTVPKYAETTISCTDAFGYLSTKVIYDRYADEVLLDNPAAYYRCDDPGNEMTDATKNGFHGAWQGNTVPDSDAGPIIAEGGSRAMNTGGVLSDISLADGRSTGNYFNLNMLGSDDITLECWLYFVEWFIGGFAGYLPIGTVQYFTGSVGFDPGASILIDQDSQISGVQFIPIILTCSCQSDTGADKKSYRVPVSPAKWHHIVLTYIKNGAMVVYVDGRVAASGATGRTADFFSLAPISGVYIENQDETGDSTTTTNWKVDEVALYPAALSATRVVAHYTAGRNGAQLELSGTRIGAILDFALWPSGLRTIGTGDSWLAMGPINTQTALDALQAVNDTEQGRLFVAGDGTITFRDRTWSIETAAANTSNATFGDSGAELRYLSLTLDGGDIEAIRNSVIVTPVSGTIGVAEDSTSITNYGTRQESLQSLHMNQGDARNLAKWRLKQFKDPSLNFTEMELCPNRVTDGQQAAIYAQILNRDFGHRVTVTRRPQGVGTAITQDRVIDGIEHTITPEKWTTRWYLSEPSPTIAQGSYWQVGNATFGKIGTFAVPY